MKSTLSGTIKHHTYTDLPELTYPPSNLSASLAFIKRVHTETCLAERQYLLKRGDAHTCIVSGGSNFVESEHRASYNNQRCYCARTGCRFHYVMHEFYADAPYVHPMFNKLFSMVHALDAVPIGAWVLWVDRDVVFTNMTDSIDDIVRRTREAHAGQDCHLIGEEEAIGAGSFLFRKTCWLLTLFSDWLSLKDRFWQCIRAPQYDQIPFLLAIVRALRYYEDPTIPDGFANFTSSGRPSSGDLANPLCHGWGHDRMLQVKWSARVQQWLRNATWRRDSRVCRLPPPKPYIHFAGQATHPPIVRCFQQYCHQWKHFTSFEAFKQTCDEYVMQNYSCRPPDGVVSEISTRPVGIWDGGILPNESDV